jgi:hypothetical protein
VGAARATPHVGIVDGVRSESARCVEAAVRAGLPPVAVLVVSAPTVTTLINKGLLFGHVVSISTGMRCVAIATVP